MLSLMDERQLTHSLALWTMKNSRFAPQLGSCEEAAFIKTFAVPETRFERVNSAVSPNGRPVSIFRTAVRLADWQSRSGQECLFVYLKAVETDTDSLGNTAEITLGYSVVSR